MVDGAALPIETRPSIMDVLMTTQQYMDANEEALTAVVGAFHDKAIGMLREDNAACDGPHGCLAAGHGSGRRH